MATTIPSKMAVKPLPKMGARRDAVSAVEVIRVGDVVIIRTPNRT